LSFWKAPSPPPFRSPKSCRPGEPQRSSFRPSRVAFGDPVLQFFVLPESKQAPLQHNTLSLSFLFAIVLHLFFTNRVWLFGACEIAMTLRAFVANRSAFCNIIRCSAVGKLTISSCPSTTSTVAWKGDEMGCFPEENVVATIFGRRSWLSPSIWWYTTTTTPNGKVPVSAIGECKQYISSRMDRIRMTAYIRKETRNRK
jgi:hypothetical protein